MKIVAQMDDIASIDIKGDSTFALLLEAQNRGHEIYYYLPSQLTLEDNIVKTHIHKIKVQNQIGNHFEILQSSDFTLKDADIILLRQDPPFDMNYITSTYILDKIKDQVLIINDPTEVRNCPEKIFVTDFEEFCPPTIICSDLKRMESFKQKHQDIVIKPLYGNGGEGIVRLGKDNQDLKTLFTQMMSKYQTAFIAQKYLPEVLQGDKRILLLNGEPIGAVNRLAKEGELRTNFHVGGTGHKTELTKRELEICKTLAPELKKRGLIFAGIDVIGDYLTEINITSPTGIKEISNLDQVDIAKTMITHFENLI